MSPGQLDFEAYLDAVSEDVERIGVVAASVGGLTVATCPHWTVEDLLDHVSGVYRRFLAQVLARDPSTFTRSGAGAALATPGLGLGARIERFEEDWHTLRRALADVGPDSPCWNFTGTDLETSFVARRMAHETSVHRIDVELTAGRAGRVEREVALDGIAELLEVGLPRALRNARDAEDTPDTPPAALAGTLCLVARDAEAAFVIEVHGGVLRWRRGRGPAEVVAVGDASDLFLFCWNRADTRALEVTGDADVLASWGQLPGV